MSQLPKESINNDTRVVYARVPTALHRRLKSASVVLDRDMGELAAEAIEEYLDREAWRIVQANHDD